MNMHAFFDKSNADKQFSLGSESNWYLLLFLFTVVHCDKLLELKHLTMDRGQSDLWLAATESVFANWNEIHIIDELTALAGREPLLAVKRCGYHRLTEFDECCYAFLHGFGPSRPRFHALCKYQCTANNFLFTLNSSFCWRKQLSVQ